MKNDVEDIEDVITIVELNNHDAAVKLINTQFCVKNLAEEPQLAEGFKEWLFKITKVDSTIKITQREYEKCIDLIHEWLEQYLQYSQSQSKPSEGISAKEVDKIIKELFPSDIKNGTKEWNLEQSAKRIGAKALYQALELNRKNNK